ncbi:MAG TPA: GNAT family N-acetyltransferase [Gemmatimonadaceae bacterium]|nr:GNAT family N-acetyltransferase [Gemmatimonadaceae bacterium]
MTPALTVHEVTDAARLVDLHDEWDAFVASSPDGSFFETYEWLTTWLACFWAPRQPAFMFVRDGGRLVGLAPFLPDDTGDAWCRRSLTLPVHSHVPRANLVAADGMRAAVVDALLAHASDRHGWTPLVFPQVDRASAAWAAIEDGARRQGRGVTQWEDMVVPWIRLDGDWDGYLQSRTAHVRQEMRRKRRKLEKAGRVEYAVTSTPRECATAINDIFAIEAKSWKQDEGTSFATEVGVSAFYTTLARLAAERGWLRLYVMSLDGAPIAHVYGIVHRNEYLALKTSYDQSFRELSPGSVLFEFAVRDACEQGYTAFDMLGIEARWKNDLATDARRLASACLIAPASLRCQSCRSYENTLKPYLKTHAPWLAALKQRITRATA